MANSETLGGGCLCGGVRFLIRGKLRNVVNCHCSMCRRFHGHFGPYTEVDRAALVMEPSRTLSWYQSSDLVRRGFCGHCGSSLFWHKDGATVMGIVAGSLDQPTGLKTVSHIHVASKADYYELSDDLPKRPVE